MINAISAPFKVGGHNNFCIRLCSELVSFADQISPYLKIVIYFTVKNHDISLVMHWLIGFMTQIDYTQAVMAKHQTVIPPGSPGIRTTVSNRNKHPINAFERMVFA